MNSKHVKLRRKILLSAAAAGAALGGGYFYITSGGLIARQPPSVMEVLIARQVLEWSVPSDAKNAKNPLENTDSNLSTGRQIYLQKCQACHGSDGGGRSDAGSGLYPPPLSFGDHRVRKETDGTLFYFVRNGIRNTGMPGWQMPDNEIWALVGYVRHLPIVAEISPRSMSGFHSSAHYVGSGRCKECHSEIYKTWSKTRMANVVTDPKLNPESIVSDFTKPSPLVSFTKDDIALVYGSKWKQRYLKRVGTDYFPLPAQWDILHKEWKPYFVKEDWWATHYPPDNFKRPTGPTCDGCHSVDYNVATHIPFEWNVGCEKCHGPGSEHAKNPKTAGIVNPSRLDFINANDTCIQCHSQGRPLNNPIADRFYDWPVGFTVGERLSDYWKFEEHRLGETSFYYFSDGTAHKNRMQGNDFVQSAMYKHGVTCFTCHDPHNSQIDSSLRKPAAQLCLDCHTPPSPNGPFVKSIEAHTHHKIGSSGSECIACHMPAIQQTLSNVFVHSHTFSFLPPAKAAENNMPNACNQCHTDKSLTWSVDALKKWDTVSPWRSQE